MDNLIVRKVDSNTGQGKIDIDNGVIPIRDTSRRVFCESQGVIPYKREQTISDTLHEVKNNIDFWVAQLDLPWDDERYLGYSSGRFQRSNGYYENLAVSEHTDFVNNGVAQTLLEYQIQDVSDMRIDGKYRPLGVETFVNKINEEEMKLLEKLRFEISDFAPGGESQGWKARLTF